MLTNVQDLTPEQINELNKGLLINTLLMLKYIWDTAFILEHSELFVANLDSSRSTQNYITSLLVYFFKNSEISSENAHRFIQKLPPSLNDNAMSTYDLIVKEGVEKGIEQTLWKNTREMLINGLDEELIRKILQVDQSFIDQVKAKIEMNKP